MANKINYDMGRISPMDWREASVDEHFAFELARLIRKAVDQVSKAAMAEEVKRGYECDCGDPNCPTLKCSQHVIDKALLILHYNHREIFFALRNSEIDEAIRCADESFGQLRQVFNLVGEIEISHGVTLLAR
ncbi:hypothetical protein [Nitrobacter vulgaris]|uniref:Uncharacterized protein n=1 Tax=Nitrobacter vulgaris TaxID=29421 RepID=A0A1V4HX05_NITVU|nr:hypothetical protein [Nitrobacter vulgaris]OPH82385.1 hypothetical protein B2M20_12415 [Nitrobacter vulgaris]